MLKTYIYVQYNANIHWLLFLVAKLLYKSKCPSVHLSVCQPRLGGNVIFSAPDWDIAPIFFVQIPLINEHLFCKYFVRLSVGNATKGFATYGCCHPCLYYKWTKKSMFQYCTLIYEWLNVGEPLPKKVDRLS